ncbi:unnamed protein product [Victoria cruziana]
MEAKGTSGWWSRDTVVVVTGGNRGIGLEVCRQLAAKGLTVIMTARKPQEQLSPPAQQFLQETAEMGRKNVIFHALDITQQRSVTDFVDWLKLRVGFIDILINNAAILNVDWKFLEQNNVDIRTFLDCTRSYPTCMDGKSEEYESARACIETNYHGTKRVAKALLPLLRRSPYKPRIVNVSSVLGLLSFVRDEELRKQLLDVESFTEQKIDGVLDMFLEDVKSERGVEKWPLRVPSYSISKTALNAYTRLLALELGDEACVNCAGPGYVTTDMTLGTGDLSPAEGAANLVSVALLPAGGPSGRNFLCGKEAEF